MAPEEQVVARALPKVSFDLKDSIILMDTSPFRVVYPTRLASPAIQVDEFLVLYKGARFNMREHLHEARTKENQRQPWEP